MQQRDKKVPYTTAGVSPKKSNTSNHMGWERVYLEQLHVLNRARDRTQQELRGILDRITSGNLEFQEKKREFDVLLKRIAEVEAHVEYHRVAQVRKEK